MRSVLSKRGQEMSISTLVLIVLAIIVLVLVVIGFTGGWSNLWDRISNLGGSKENVQLVVQACGIACSSDSQYDYCSRLREVNFGKGNVPSEFSAVDVDGDGKIKATCGSIAKAKVGGLVCDSFASTSGCEQSSDDQTSASSNPSDAVGPPTP